MKPAFIAIAIVLGTSVITAQRGAPATLLQMADASIPTHEVMTASADFPPQSDTGWHTHPGDMVGYMITGSVVTEQAGKPPQTMRAGQSFIIPAGVAHTHANVGDTPARMFATYFIEKGKQLRTNVERP